MLLGVSHPSIHSFISLLSNSPFHSLNLPVVPFFSPSVPLLAMTSPGPPQPRGIDYSLPTCGELQCNSHGRCVIPMGGGADLVCECDLGYRGELCDDTVNGALSLPLTLSVVFVIIGLLILAFIVAKLRQRQKKNHRYSSIRVIRSGMNRTWPPCCSNCFIFSAYVICTKPKKEGPSKHIGYTHNLTQKKDTVHSDAQASYKP